MIFPDEELQILDYNRVVKDLNGLDVDAFLAAIEDHFMIEKKDVFLTGRRKRSFRYVPGR